MSISHLTVIPRASMSLLLWKQPMPIKSEMTSPLVREVLEKSCGQMMQSSSNTKTAQSPACTLKVVRVLGCVEGRYFIFIIHLIARMSQLVNHWKRSWKTTTWYRIFNMDIIYNKLCFLYLGMWIIYIFLVLCDRQLPATTSNHRQSSAITRNLQ